MQITTNYLSSIKWMFNYCKELGDKTLAQIDDEQIHWKCNKESNSIAIIVQHMAGNMLSRLTDFLTTDGEKPWRKRDDEFEVHSIKKITLLEQWNKGWNCLFNTINSLTENDLTKTVFIRNEQHTVIEAINRQIAHLSYHVGQIVLIAKMILNENWKTLSIPKGKSKEFNAGNFLKK